MTEAISDQNDELKLIDSGNDAEQLLQNETSIGPPGWLKHPGKHLLHQHQKIQAGEKEPMHITVR